MYDNYNNINKLCETYLHYIQLGNVEEVERWLKNESIWTEDLIKKLKSPKTEERKEKINKQERNLILYI